MKMRNRRARFNRRARVITYRVPAWVVDEIKFKSAERNRRIDDILTDILRRASHSTLWGTA